MQQSIHGGSVVRKKVKLKYVELGSDIKRFYDYLCENDNDMPAFYLKEAIMFLFKIAKTGRYIYYAERRWQQNDYVNSAKGMKGLFDYEKGLDALIFADKIGDWIMEAGKEWACFNYDKGFDAIEKIDKKGNLLCSAGQEWKKFNFIKGLNSLVKHDKVGKWICEAGSAWRQFDFEKGLDALVEVDRTGGMDLQSRRYLG